MANVRRQVSGRGRNGRRRREGGPRCERHRLAGDPSTPCTWCGVVPHDTRAVRVVVQARHDLLALRQAGTSRQEWLDDPSTLHSLGRDRRHVLSGRPVTGRADGETP